MKKSILYMILFLATAQLQAQGVRFGYDTHGNRISRRPIGIDPESKAQAMQNAALAPLLQDMPEELANSEIKVFPNPAQAPAALYLNKELPADARWKLISPFGEIVESGLLQEGHLNIKHTNLSSGIYWIEFNRGGKWLGTAKWVVQ